MRIISSIVVLLFMLGMFSGCSSESAQGAPGDPARGTSPHYQSLDDAVLPDVLASYFETSWQQALSGFYSEHQPRGWEGETPAPPPTLPAGPQNAASAAAAVLNHPTTVHSTDNTKTEWTWTGLE